MLIDQGGFSPRFYLKAHRVGKAISSWAQLISRGVWTWQLCFMKRGDAGRTRRDRRAGAEEAGGFCLSPPTPAAPRREGLAQQHRSPGKAHPSSLALGCARTPPSAARGIGTGQKSAECIYCGSGGPHGGRLLSSLRLRTRVQPPRGRCAGMAPSFPLRQHLPAPPGAVRGVKKPVTRLSPRSIAVSGPLCCNYFRCRVRPRAPGAKAKPLPLAGRRGEARPAGTAAHGPRPPTSAEGRADFFSSAAGAGVRNAPAEHEGAERAAFG